MNNTLIKTSLLALIGGVALTLAGCGDSSSDDSTSSPIAKVAIPSTPTTITSTNQNTVVAETAVGIQGASSFGSSPLGVAVQAPATSRFSAFDFARGTVLDALGQAITKQKSLPSAVAHALTFLCDSGSISITANFDPIRGTLIKDDSFSISFNNCKDNTDGTTSNGSISAVVVSGTLAPDCDGSGSCSDYAFALSFNDLQITELGESFLIDGGFTASYASATNTNTMTGDSFYAYSSTGEGMQMSNFEIASTLSGSMETTIITRMTLASTRTGGSVQIQTRAGSPLVIADINNDDYPSSGVLEITGASSTLIVTAISATMVQLELNGGSPTTVSWADLESTI